MPKELIIIVLLIISGTEIFFNIVTKAFEKIIGLLKKDFRFNEKAGAVIKLIFIATFMVCLGYFIVIAVKAFASWLGISLNQSFLDIFR